MFIASRLQVCGTSSVVHWLRVHASNAGSLGSIPGGGIHTVASCPSVYMVVFLHLKKSSPASNLTLHLTQFFFFSLCHVKVVSLDSSISIQHRIHNSYASLVPCFTYIYASSSYLPWGPESRQAWKLVEWMQVGSWLSRLSANKVMIHVTVTARELPIRNDF